MCRTGWPVVGGLEAAVRGLAGAQARIGHDVRVVTLDHGPDGVRLHPCQQDGVRWVRVRGLGPRGYRAGAGVRDALVGADVIHVHGLGGLADQVVRLRGRAPVAISTHGGFGHTPRLRRVKAAWLRTVVRRTLRAADAVWYSSEADREALRPASVHGEVLPNGIDLAQWASVARRPVPGRWIVVGRVDVHKGIDDAIRALAALEPPRPTLHVIGPQPSAGWCTQLGALAREAGLAPSVRFEGAVVHSALRAWLATAEVALFPSHYEGFGIALAEAMAAGVPAVVSPITAHQEQVVHGVDGWVVDFRSDDAGVRLADLRRHDLASVAARARRSAERFAWPRVLERYEAGYAAMARA